MAQNITLLGASYSDVPAVTLPKTGGGTASFTDVSDTTATASDVAAGTYFYTAAGVRTEGTGSGGGGVIVTETTDVGGGKIVEITATQITGTKSITANGTGIDVSTYQYADVAVPAPTPTLQTIAKSYTPSESQQTEAVTYGTGYDGIDTVNVTVGAISSTYVGSGITQRTSSDLSASGATVSVPSGYYASNASKAVSSGSATAPASISGTSASVSTGTNTLTLSKTVSVTPSVSAGYVSSGTAGNSSVSLTASVTTKAAATYHPSTSDQTISASQYLTGAQTVKAVTMSNLTADNIKSGVVVQIGDSTDADCVASVTGTYTGGGSGKNIQYYLGRDEVAATAYTETDVSVKISKAGTYKCAWSMDRNTTSGTNGSQLYKNGSAVGSAHTTWTHNGASCEETLTLAANDTLVVRARSRNTSYYVGVSNLICIEQ